jgi:hypothetical protein
MNDFSSQHLSDDLHKDLSNVMEMSEKIVKGDMGGSSDNNICSLKQDDIHVGVRGTLRESI